MPPSAIVFLFYCAYPRLLLAQQILPHLQTEKMAMNRMRVEDKSLPQAELATFAREAREKICPYSHATRGNVDVTLEVIGA